MGFRLDSKHWIKCSVSAFSSSGPGILGITVVVTEQPFQRRKGIIKCTLKDAGIDVPDDY